MGLAFCFSDGLACQKALDLLEGNQLKIFAAKALTAANASNAPGPIQHVKETIAHCFDLHPEKDKEAFDALLQELESMQVDIYSPV